MKTTNPNNAAHSNMKLQNLLDQFMDGSAGSTSDLTQSIGDAPVRLTDNVPVRLAGGLLSEPP
jgi:hypothetical protein